MVIVPLVRDESQVGPDRAFAPDHPRIVNLEPSDHNRLQAIGGRIGKYSDREHCESAARSTLLYSAGYHR
jgi:hypothetical protein